MSLADRVVVMSEGSIHQNASPMQIYDDPANTFVAHFVGSPGMNMFQGIYESAKQQFVSNDTSLQVSLANMPISSQSSIALGVRAEHVLPSDDSGMRGEVIIDEYLGHCRYVHVQIGEQLICMRVDAQSSIKRGDTCGLSFDTEHVCVFDETGQRCS